MTHQVVAILRDFFSSPSWRIAIKRRRTWGIRNIPDPCHRRDDGQSAVTGCRAELGHAVHRLLDAVYRLRLRDSKEFEETREAYNVCIDFRNTAGCEHAADKDENESDNHHDGLHEVGSAFG